MSRNKWKSSIDEYIGEKPILTPEKKAIILSQLRKNEKKSYRKSVIYYGLGLTAALIMMVVINYSFLGNQSDHLPSPGDSGESLQKELNALNKENEELRGKLSGLSSDLQVFDHIARNFVSLLGSENFNELKTQYKAEFNISDSTIQFDGYEGAYFPLEWVDLPMRFVFINQSSEVTEVGYYLYDGTPGEERKYSVVFGFNENHTIKYIANGD